MSLDVSFFPKVEIPKQSMKNPKDQGSNSNSKEIRRMYGRGRTE